VLGDKRQKGCQRVCRLTSQHFTLPEELFLLLEISLSCAWGIEFVACRTEELFLHPRELLGGHAALLHFALLLLSRL
jgi:hypothetical protein